MADYSDPKRATAYRFTISLYARSDNQIDIAPTLAAGDVKVSKDNGATANITTLPVETPASSGILQVDLSATEMTADLVTIIFRDAAGAEWNDVAVHIATAPRQMADLAFPNTSGRGMDIDASGGVEVGSFQTGAITTAAFTAGAINAAAIAADAITDAKVASDVTIASVTGAVGSVTGAVGSVTGNVGGNVTGSVGSVATGGIMAASIAADAIGASELAADAVTEIAAGVWAAAARTLTANTNLNDLSAAGVRAAIGLASANLDTQLTAIDDFLDTEIAAIKAKTDNLPADPADASDIAARFTTLDTAVADLPTNAELTAALGTADDAVLAQVALVKAKTDLIPAAPAAVGDIPTAAVIADAVWDEATAGHTTAGTTGKALTDAGSAGDPWATVLPGAYGAGTAGKLVGDNINAPIATVDTVVDAIKAKTDSLTFTVAGQVDSNIQYVNDVQVNGTGAPGSEWGP